MKVLNDHTKYHHNEPDSSNRESGIVEVVNFNTEVPLVSMTVTQLEFMGEGQVVPHQEGTYYFMPYVFKRLGSSNIFERYFLADVDMGKVGFTETMLRKITSSLD